MIQVSSSENPARLAMRIREAMIGTGYTVIHASGSGSIKRAVKALAIARRDSGRNLAALPDFMRIEQGRLWTIRIVVKDLGALVDK